MKSILKILTISIFLIPGFTVSAQDAPKKIHTVEIPVSGVCKMCEKRIENAALIKGVKMADWNKNTQKLKVVYNTKKTTEEAIHEAIAKVGHDTDKVKATDKVYNKLPACCAYRDGVEVH